MIRRRALESAWTGPRELIIFGMRTKVMNKPIEALCAAELIQYIKRDTMTPILSGVRWPGRRAINDGLEYGDES